MKNNNKNFLLGAIFGLIAPFIGVFAGLQVASFIGTILMFPIIILSKMIGQPFGNFSATLMILSIVLSITCWGFVFMGLAKITSKLKS